MKSIINPKYELANRIAKYLMSFDDNKEVNAPMREELGKKFHKNEYENYCRAMKWWTKAATQGNKSSQYIIGSSYYFGYEVYRNYKKAAYWLEKAALQDDDWAQLLLGDCYYLGRGVAKNYKTADDILVSGKHGLKPYFFSVFFQEKVRFQVVF